MSLQATMSLEVIAAEAAMKAAVQFARVHKLDLKGKEDALVDNLKAEVPNAVTQGLKDAKDAMAIGMKAVAEQTFIASLRLAGIRAAQKTFGIE